MISNERRLVAMASQIQRIRPRPVGEFLSGKLLKIDSRLRGNDYRIENLGRVRRMVAEKDYLAKKAKCASYSAFDDLRKNPLGFYDVGARGGPWIDSYLFGDFLTIVLCEPDRSQRRSLNRTRGFQKVHVETRLIGASEGSATFYRTRKPGGSSTLKPKGVRTDNLEVVGAAIRDVVSIEQVSGDLGIPCEALKIDTQGSELSVLSGLAQIPYCIRVEVSTVEWYDGLPLASRIVEELSQRGYLMISDPSLLEIPGFHGDIVFSYNPLGGRRLIEACDPIRWLVAHASLGGLIQPYFKCPADWNIHRDFLMSIAPNSSETRVAIAQVLEENGSRFVHYSQKMRVR